MRRGAKERVVSQLTPQTHHPVPPMPSGVYYLFTLFFLSCYVFPCLLSRFDREAPRGGPQGRRHICARYVLCRGILGGLLQAPWGARGVTEGKRWRNSGSSTVHILNAQMLRTYPEAHIKMPIDFCTNQTHINGNPFDYKRSVCVCVLCA